MLLLALAMLSAASSSSAAAGDDDVVSYSFPAFNATTTADGSLVAATNWSILTTAALLFDSEVPTPEFKTSEGFLLLSDAVDVWRSGGGGGGGGPSRREASFNTSFTVGGAGAPSPPVAFVVLLDRYPPLYNRARLRGHNVSADGDDGNATSSLAAVEVGPVRSYAPESPTVGLNVTITPKPNGTTSAPGGSTVWIQYNAVVHRLSVYLAAGGEARPPKALLQVPLYLASGTTQTALVGFFAAEIRDIIGGVRDWDLTVERLSGGGGKKSTSRLLILLAVLGSVAGAAAIMSVVVYCFVLRGRRRRDVVSKQCSNEGATTKAISVTRV